MSAKIDFNCDMGESFGAWKMGLDEEVIKHVTSTNVACGYHAGDPVWMQHTVNLAKENGVAIGAHPSYPDLLGFGRRNMTATPEEARAYVKYQVGALQGFMGGAKLQHVKAHGALYNTAVKNDDLAKGICQAILDIDPEIILVVLAGSQMGKNREGDGQQDCPGDVCGQGFQRGRDTGSEVGGRVVVARPGCGG